MATSHASSHQKARATLRRGSKKLFWSWILYQTVKGTLTTSLIWVPLALAWWRG
jgi:hypothetical protein